MPVDKEHIFDPGIYFITFTNHKWRPLFRIADGYDIVYDWFDTLKAGGHSVLGLRNNAESCSCIDWIYKEY